MNTNFNLGGGGGGNEGEAEGRKKVIDFEKVKNIKSIVPLSLSLDELMILDEYKQRKKQKNRSQAARDLMQLGYLIFKNLPKIEDSSFAEEIRMQIQEGDIVSYVKSLNHSQFNTLSMILKNEERNRGLK